MCCFIHSFLYAKQQPNLYFCSTDPTAFSGLSMISINIRIKILYLSPRENVLIMCNRLVYKLILV